MSNLTIEEIAADLSLSVEFEGDFAYRLSDDGTYIRAEHYAIDGEIDARYRLDITITKEH